MMPGLRAGRERHKPYRPDTKKLCSSWKRIEAFQDPPEPEKKRCQSCQSCQVIMVLLPGPEKGGADTDDGRPFFDGHFKVMGHTHGKVA
jgi:hypothetical protein